MMLTLIKLGGSLITDKQVEASYREAAVQQVAEELKDALAADPGMGLILGHGSGSFGHFAAKRYNTINGVHSPEEWRGFAEVALAASDLNHHVAHTLWAAGLPVWRAQPSASAISNNVALDELATGTILQAVEHGLLPLVYGDVAFDRARGGTIISTETIFFFLAEHLPVDRILLLGEVPGVYDHNHEVVPSITPQNIDSIASALGGSGGVDVTGGMATKVRDMLNLTLKRPGLTIRIMDGGQPDLLAQTLLGKASTGTLLSSV
ncbi:MAG: isopentenyl phosphate kinase family protein [Anaerolineae bacterium]|nr:isopentenyl phosphate kinase family protein [Anaerolineae bacterium]